MIEERHNDKDINLKVLEKLKPIICSNVYTHGDLKVNLKSDYSSIEFNQPENIFVDYDYNGSQVTNFKMVVGDWGSGDVGTAGGAFYGGTPVYAGPNTFYGSYDKDLFSFGRIAMELFTDKSGTESK